MTIAIYYHKYVALATRLKIKIKRGLYLVHTFVFNFLILKQWDFNALKNSIAFKFSSLIQNYS